MPIEYLFWSSKTKEISRRRLMRTWARCLRGSSSKSDPAFASCFSSSTKSASSLLMIFSALRVIWQRRLSIWVISWIDGGTVINNHVMSTQNIESFLSMCYSACITIHFQHTSSFRRTSASPVCMIGASLPSPSMICSMYDVMFPDCPYKRRFYRRAFMNQAKQEPFKFQL